MKQQHKQPNYFGLTSSICSVCKWSAMVCRPAASGLQLVCIGLQLMQTSLHGLQICVEHDRQNNVLIAIFIPIE